MASGGSSVCGWESRGQGEAKGSQISLIICAPVCASVRMPIVCLHCRMQCTRNVTGQRGHSISLTVSLCSLSSTINLGPSPSPSSWSLYSMLRFSFTVSHCFMTAVPLTRTIGDFQSLNHYSSSGALFFSFSFPEKETQINLGKDQWFSIYSVELSQRKV